MMLHSATFARALHWIIAMLVLAALVSGYAMTSADLFFLRLLQAHVVFGIFAGLLTLVRVLVWFIQGAPPHSFAVSSRLQKFAANLVHGLLRLLPLALLASGAGMMALSGSLPAFLDGSLADLAVFQNLPPRNLHHITAFLLAVLTALHVGAALLHWCVGLRLRHS